MKGYRAVAVASAVSFWGLTAYFRYQWCLRNGVIEKGEEVQALMELVGATLGPAVLLGALVHGVLIICGKQKRPPLRREGATSEKPTS